VHLSKLCVLLYFAMLHCRYVAVDDWKHACEVWQVGTCGRSVWMRRSLCFRVYNGVCYCTFHLYFFPF